MTYLMILHLLLPESEVRIDSIWCVLQPYLVPILSGYEEEHEISSELFSEISKPSHPAKQLKKNHMLEVEVFLYKN